MKIYSLFTVIAVSLTVSAQQPATSSHNYKNAISQKIEQEKLSIVKNIPFTNIGPTVMSGRVVDLAVNPNNPIEFYVAYASGGLWYTHNNGTSFVPVLDNSSTQNIGDIAVDWNNNTIWVGTGENNASRSSYAGIGILKSTDGGKNWQHMGLHDSHHIGRILINPNNPNEVIVGVTGHLYSQNNQRGIYKTLDGGKTWQQTLFINNETGIIDLTHAPENFNILYASAWQKDRKAWNFKGNGSASGIYKSTDAGDSWQLISTKESGFPTGNGVGRIGIAVFDENILYAVHDNQFLRKADNKNSSKEDLNKEDFKTMSVTQFLELDNKKLNNYLKTNGFQEKYRAENVKQMVKNGTVKPLDLAKYLEDANAMLFDTPVIGAEIYRSNNGGKTWAKTHDGYLDDIYYSYGYYFGHIYVSPKNKDHIYTYGVPILKSKDAGKTFTSINAENVHVDHHALWINPQNPNHLINGNDGGVNISFDDGATWIKNNTPAVGQFYAVNVDHQTPYNVYGGLQDNGVWVGAHNTKEDEGWYGSGKYPWDLLIGGDGMQVQIDSRNPDIVYTGFQFGNYFRINRKTGERKYLEIKHELGESPYRFNWQTPILLSPHNQDILYMGGNKLHRSMDQGESWATISNDLTTGGKKGNVAYGTLTSIDESIFQFGLIYTGSDDGYVHITQNGGGSWKKISDTFPKDLWISKIIASKHKKERVYVALNGYRWDDFTPYVFKSDDYGTTWKAIHSNLPLSPVNVIREDPKNENILYLGTDNGVYVSFNKGEYWHSFKNGLPNVAVHDLVIQSQENHLVLGTHGRSIYIADISPLQEFNNTIEKSILHIFKNKDVMYNPQWGNSWNAWLEPQMPTISFTIFTTQPGNYSAKILDENGIVLNQINITAEKGFNYIDYNATLSKEAVRTIEKQRKNTLKQAKNGNYYLEKGTYTLKINNETQTFIIK